MLETEYISPRYKGIDTWPVHDISLTFWESQMRAITSVKPALPTIEKASHEIARHLFHPESRLVYVGAGTSGLLAMQDAMEITPTFGWPLERIIFLMAGGDKARLTPIGDSEDNIQDADNDVRRHRICQNDVVIAVAASGTTPYTLNILREAQKRHALTVGLANNLDAPLFAFADHAICLRSGAEVIAGSTRLNAGTAQKCALGILSSMVMMNMGHVVDGMMVSVTVDNDKLRDRAVNTVSKIATVSKDTALEAMVHADGSVKKGVLLALGCSEDVADNLLFKYKGDLRKAMSAHQADMV